MPRRADIGIRIRADGKFARIVDRAAVLSGQTRSSFIRSAALLEARRIIQTPWNEELKPSPTANLSQADVEALNSPTADQPARGGGHMTYDQWKTTDPRDAQPDEDRPCKFETFSGECLACGAGLGEECEWERERR